VCINKLRELECSSQRSRWDGVIVSQAMFRGLLKHFFIERVEKPTDN